MKKKQVIIRALNVLAIVLVGGFLIVHVRAAGGATMSLSPSGGSYNINSTLSITVTENSNAEAVNSVQADLVYDPSKLQYTGVNTDMSSFTIGAVATGGNGNVSIQRGNISGLTGSKTVAVVNFKVLAGSGTTAVSFANSSLLYRASDNFDIWNHNLTGATYTLTTPPTGTVTPPPATPAPVPKKTTTPAPAAATPSTPTPTIAEQEQNPAEPIPVAVDTGTQSYLVAIKVVDAQGNVVPDAKVTIGEQTATTDKTGLAGFVGIKAGNYKVSVSSVKGVSTLNVDVKAQNPTQVQTFDATVKPANQLIWYLGGAVALLALAGAGFYLVKSGLGARTVERIRPANTTAAIGDMTKSEEPSVYSKPVVGVDTPPVGSVTEPEPSLSNDDDKPKIGK